ncbi:uncharacterized protein LOC143519236 [Brachyhypopomus gauderio]|uniref:uncharacterized protein LOC143519236 n=1 Tax=Brachyhypopomus gauderio TaxID=698409 RepID=UPI00404283FC
MLPWHRFLFLLWITAERPLILPGLSVKFPCRESVNVALGRTLVLKAQFDIDPTEEIRLVTWDRKSGSQEVRLATNAATRDPRVSVKMNHQQLQITGVQDSDYGTYTVTVTNDKGTQRSDSVNVENVQTPKASLSLTCTVQRQETCWDIPTFTWLLDGIKATNGTVDMSEDGSTIYLQRTLAHNYTCIVDSNQGTSVVEGIQVPEPGPTPEPCPGPNHAGLIAAVVIEALVIVIFIGYCYKQRQRP